MVIFWRKTELLKKIDYKYFEKARTVATISDFHKFHIGCVAVYQGKIIGYACNLQKTHPLQKEYNIFRNHEDNANFIPRIHAEINCIASIRKLDVDFGKVKLYVYRERTLGGKGLSRPCAACMAAIKDLGIKDIYYTTDDGFVYEKVG